MTHYNADVDVDGESIEITLTGEFGYVEGWSEAKEDLGLNKAGPEPVDGVSVVSSEPEYYEDSDRVRSYSEVVLHFDNEDALEAARERLYDKATGRFEWGIARSAEKVQEFASALPVVRTMEKGQ